MTTPSIFMAYKHSLLPQKMYNDPMYAKDWLSLDFQQTYNARNQTVKLIDASQLKIGKNVMVNRWKIIIGKISFDWLNLSWQR